MSVAVGARNGGGGRGRSGATMTSGDGGGGARTAADKEANGTMADAAIAANTTAIRERRETGCKSQTGGTSVIKDNYSILNPVLLTDDAVVVVVVVVVVPRRGRGAGAIVRRVSPPAAIVGAAPTVSTAAAGRTTTRAATGATTAASTTAAVAGTIGRRETLGFLSGGSPCPERSERHRCRCKRSGIGGRCGPGRF